MMIVQATVKEIEELGFKPRELACKCCGVLRVDLLFLQRMRGAWDVLEPYNIWPTSCSRCWEHHAAEYARTGGKPPENSAHLVTGKEGDERLSYGMDFGGKYADLKIIKAMLWESWKGGFSFYDHGEKGSSLHFDTGRKRRW